MGKKSNKKVKEPVEEIVEEQVLEKQEEDIIEETEPIQEPVEIKKEKNIKTILKNKIISEKQKLALEKLRKQKS